MSSRNQHRSRGLVALLPLLFLGCSPQPVQAPVASQGSTATQETRPEPADSQPQADASQPSFDATASEYPATGPDPFAPEETEMSQETETEDADGGPLTAAELEDEYVPDPEILAELEAQRQALRQLADTYDPPPQAKQLGKEADLWVDLKAKRVYIDGYVSIRRGPLEMLACPVGTKEHESVIALFAKSSDVHAALLAIGAQSGTTARWDPEFLPPTGQTIAVWIAYRDPKLPAETDGEPKPQPQPFEPQEEFKVVDARKWVRQIETEEELSEPWVFSGSSFWSDPEEGIEHYSANGGDMICVSNFSTAMMDVPFPSSADAGNVLFEPFAERIPLRGTPVRLVLVPQPIAEDADESSTNGDSATGDRPEAAQPPTESILPLAK